MVPREIFDYSTSRGAAHLLHDFRMSVQMLDRCCDCVDITRLHNNSFHTVAHDIARFTRGDLGQPTCRGFIRHFGAAFPLRWKNMYRALHNVILRTAHKSHYPDVIAPELFKKRFRFVMHVANQPQFRIRQVETVPCFKYMLDAFALDQSSGKNCAKFCQAISRFKSLHIHAARQVKESFLRETANAKRVSRPLRQDKQKVSELVFFYETLSL